MILAVVSTLASRLPNTLCPTWKWMVWKSRKSLLLWFKNAKKRSSTVLVGRLCRSCPSSAWSVPISCGLVDPSAWVWSARRLRLLQHTILWVEAEHTFVSSLLRLKHQLIFGVRYFEPVKLGRDFSCFRNQCRSARFSWWFANPLPTRLGSLWLTQRAGKDAHKMGLAGQTPIFDVWENHSPQYNG